MENYKYNLEDELLKVDFSDEFDKNQKILSKLTNKLNSNNITIRRSAAKRYRFVTALLLTSILIISTTSVLAKDYIVKLIFGDNDATQVESLVSDYDGTILSSQVTLNNYVANYTVDDLITSIWIKFATLEETEDYLSFTPKGATYLPKGYSFDHAELWKFESGIIYPDMINLIYKHESNGAWFTWNEQYCGEGVSISVETVDSIETIQVNGLDVLLIARRTTPSYEIHWVNNGIYYNTSAPNKEDAIKTIESIK